MGITKQSEHDFAFKWWGMPWPKKMAEWHKDHNFPLNEKDLCVYCNINESTRQKWKKEYAQQTEALVQKLEEKTDYPQVEGHSLDPAEMSDGEMLKWLNRFLFEAMKDKKYKAAELMAKIRGLLIEKQEVTHTLDASEYFRIREEARRRAEELERDTDGDRRLFEQRFILPQKIREDT